MATKKKTTTKTKKARATGTAAKKSAGKAPKKTTRKATAKTATKKATAKRSTAKKTVTKKTAAGAAKKKTTRAAAVPKAAAGSKKSKKAAKAAEPVTKVEAVDTVMASFEQEPPAAIESVAEIALEAASEETWNPDSEAAAVSIMEPEPAEPAMSTEADDVAVAVDVMDEVEGDEESIPTIEDDEESMASTDVGVIGDELQLVCFTLNDEEYGVDIQRVQEINRVSRVTTVPDAPAYVKGIIDLRGNVIPIVDLRLRLGYPVREDDKHTRIVVLDFDGRLIGLIVDAVTEVLRVSRSHIERTPNLAATAGRECLEGIYQQDAKMILIIDYRKILQF